MTEGVISSLMMEQSHVKREQGLLHARCIICLKMFQEMIANKVEQKYAQVFTT